MNEDLLPEGDYMYSVDCLITGRENKVGRPKYTSITALITIYDKQRKVSSEINLYTLNPQSRYMARFARNIEITKEDGSFTIQDIVNKSLGQWGVGHFKSTGKRMKLTRFINTAEEYGI